MKNNRQPEIRFPEFEDDWKQSELGDITIKIGSGKTPRGGSSVYSLLGIPFLRSQNIYNDTVNFSDIVYITESMDSEMANSRVQEDDILLNITGASIGRSAVYESSEFANVNQHVCIIRLNPNFDPHFLQLNLTSTKGQKQIENSQAGGGREGLNFQQISKMRFFFPNNKEEQIRIGKFLKLLDKTINLHQQELTILKQTKQGFLQKMFPKEGESVPKVRFPGFTDAWEQWKLGELAEIVGGGTPSTSNNEYWDGDINWYSPVEIGEQIYVNGSQKKITELGLQKSSARILPVGTVLFTSRAGIGNTAILAKEGSTNQGFQSIVPHQDKLDSYFIFSRTHELKCYGETNGAGSTFVEVSGKQMAKMPILIPTMAEQQEIGKFFKQIDNLITLHQCELEALQQTKKAFLQKMFV